MSNHAHNSENGAPHADSETLPDELKLELSRFFTAELHTAKARLQHSEAVLGSIASNEDLAPYAGLSIFNGALQQLARHPRIPEHTKLRLQALDINMWPMSAEDIPSFTQFTSIVLDTLSTLLTPEAVSALHEHLGQIFLSPATQARKK